MGEIPIFLWNRDKSFFYIYKEFEHILYNILFTK